MARFTAEEIMLEQLTMEHPPAVRALARAGVVEEWANAHVEAMLDERPDTRGTALLGDLADIALCQIDFRAIEAVILEGVPLAERGGNERVAASTDAPDWRGPDTEAVIAEYLLLAFPGAREAANGGGEAMRHYVAGISGRIEEAGRGLLNLLLTGGDARR